MPLRNGVPFKFKPRGVTDTFDGMNAPPGSMSSLSDLIPDPSTLYAFECRPAMQSISDFTGFNNPGNVSWAVQLNNLVYGLIATDRTPGFDEPFVYNLKTNSFVTVQGVTAGNVPTTQPTTGEWTPPTAVATAAYVVFTHPGFNGSGNGYFGYFDVSNFTQTANADTTSGSPILTGNYPLAGVQVGYKVSGAGIPVGSRVINVSNVSGNTTGDTTSGSSSVVNVVAFIPVGSRISSSSIPDGVTVTAISGSPGNYTVTLSQNATGTSVGVILFYSGTTITLSQNATVTANTVAITITGGTSASPLWSSGNTTSVGLTGVPTSVSLFYDRFYFAVGNTTEFTDTLSLNRTNGTQAITIGNSTPITALSLFTITTTSSGILQGLLAFKADTIFQITGDLSLGTLAINALNTAAGTIAPSSVTPTPNGVFFMANDGLRIVQVDGTVSEPNQDLRLPFINALFPSRVNGAYNSDTFRICVQNSGVIGTPWQEYWFDLSRDIWTGPHTCQQDVATPWGSGFVCFSHLHAPNMFTSYVTQVAGSSFTEYGQPLNWMYATSPIGEEDSLLVNSVNITTINLAFTAGASPVTCSASDESSGVLSTAVINVSAGATIWGFFIWGLAVWAGAAFGIRPHTIPWTNPLVFTKMIFQATSASSLGFKISNLRFLLQPANYYPPI